MRQLCARGAVVPAHGIRLRAPTSSALTLAVLLSFKPDLLSNESLLLLELPGAFFPQPYDLQQR